MKHLFVSLAASALFAALPAHAVGQLADVTVIDRDSGASLPVYRHQGDWWVAGRPGARYAVQVRNVTRGRILGVMSVDGVNVLSGDTASWAQGGYVFGAGQSYQITGWRKSDAEVAAFHFTALPDAYAARTGRPDNVGVIGVALFRERAAPPPPIWREAPATRDSAAAPAPAAEARADAQASTRAKAAPQAAPRLGTGHGERQSSAVTTTEFERRSSHPDEVVTLRYDSRDNLIARGVIPPREPRPPRRPDAFPQAPEPGYVPDPPGWR